MRNTVWLLIMVIELFFAATSANSGNTAETILFCFSAYLCLQFMKGGGDTNG